MATEYYPSRKACGAQELASYFHARNVMYFAQSPTIEELDKLRGFSNVVFSLNGGGESEPASIERNASKLAEISRSYPNVIGAMIDDLSSQYISPQGRYRLSPNELGGIRRTLSRGNPSLKLYGVFYTMNFDLDLAGYVPHVDVVSLWIWENIRDLRGLDAYVAQCPKIFPEKPILLGLYMYDFPSNRLMPMDLLEFEFERAAKYIREKKIVGFQILGRYSRDDMETPQARWIRDFIKENFE
jgi:hypothetical protein